MLQKTKKPLTLLSPKLLKENQISCIERLFEYDASLIVAGMGFGKTVCTLTAIAELIAEGVVRKVLILAPLKVCKTVWRQEASKWEHTAGLSIDVAVGAANERIAAIDSGAEVVLLNYENLVWFCKTYKKNDHGFDGLVCDEISKLKSSKGAGYKKLKPRLPTFTWRVGLTGTPVSEDFEGLYAQTCVLDSGERFGTRKDKFLQQYFFNEDFQGYNWTLRDPTGAELLDKVKDLMFIADNKTYKESLPPIHHHTVPVILPDKARAAYDTLKKYCVLEDITAANAAVLMGKLQQAASGFIYGEDLEGEFVVDTHFEKLDACQRVIDWHPGPIIIAYWFGEDFDRLRERYPDAVAMKGKDDQETIDRWNAGEIDILLLQPRSAGHGLQLQFGGSGLLWYGPVWSRDLTEQTEARVWRRGQENEVHIYTLCSVDTADELVMQRVEDKAQFAELLTEHLG